MHQLTNPSLPFEAMASANELVASQALGVAGPDGARAVAPHNWQDTLIANKRLIAFVAACTMLLTSLILSIVAIFVATSSGPEHFPRVPSGVNVGGWLNLEDWFYSGVHGKSVSTGSDFPNGQGACLPPRLPQLDGFRWSSEGNLTYRLLSLPEINGSKEKVADLFMAHRRSFIGNHDLKMMADSGIRHIRAPVNWAAFADALSFLDKDEYGSHDPEKDAVVVMDPYYNTTHAFVTVPRKWLADFIRNAGKYGMTVLLDMHAFPGGSSEGTYNGIWPSHPVFWTSNSSVGSPVPLTEVGQHIVKAMVSWLEQQDDEVLKAVRGVTVMNEPGHLSANADWATEDGILAWLAEASQTFRASSLPSKGVRLYMNVIETAFKDFTGTVKPWFEKTFSKSERSNWAVMDKHYYMAWGGAYFSGRTSSGGKYFCDQAIDDIKQLLRTILTDWADGFKKDFPDSLRSCSEFSVGTFDLATEACTDPLVVETFLDEEVRAFNNADIEPFFWTWRMPYGPTFEPGWSLKYVLGHEIERPNPLACLAPQQNTTTPENTTAEVFTSRSGFSPSFSSGLGAETVAASLEQDL